MKKNDIGEEKTYYLVSIMVAVSFVIASLAIGISYYVSFEQKRLGLIETVQSQARMIEAMAKFDAQFSAQDHPEGSFGATLSQVIKAHANSGGFGETGEFTFARREGNQIVFLLSRRFLDMDKPGPVPFDSDIAEPMRRALKGESGSIEGLDYRGEEVLAAFEPVNWPGHQIGIVVKMDLSEIRRPFAIAGLITGLLMIIILGFGIFVFKRITRPFDTYVSGISTEGKTDYWFLLAPVFLSAVILYIDTSIPLGVAGGVPYVALFLFSILSPTRFFIISIGILGTIMTVVGFFLSPEGGLMWMALINRFLAIFAIWITAILTLYHKETEIKAVESARSLEKSQEIAHIGSFDWNIKTNEISWSDETYKIFGRKPQEFNPTYETFLDAIHPDDRETVKQAVDELINNDTVYNIEYTIVRPDNQERVIHDRTVVYRDDLGKPLHMVGVAHDITERKKSEKALLESELWMRSIYSSLDEAILVVSPDRKIINFNEAAQKIFGYSFEELSNISTEAFHVDRQHYVEFGKRIRQAFDEGQTANFEFVSKKKSGDIFPSEHTVSLLKNPDGETLGIVSVVRDITERKKVEESLSSSEQKFRALTQSASDAIITADSEGKIVTWNRAAETIFGYSKDEALSQNIDILVHERYQERHRRAFELAGLTGGLKNAGRTIEVEGVKKDGSEFPIELSLSSWRMDEILFFTSIIRDITERKRVEEELGESEQRLRKLSETAFEGMVVAEMGKVIECNAAFAAMFGYTHDEVIGISVIDLTAPEDFETVSENIAKRHEGIYEVNGLKKDGSTFPIEVHGVAASYHGRMARITAIRDITERKRTEEELLKHRDHLEELVNNRTDEIKLIQKIAIAANEASTVDEAMLTCISKVCGYTGWEMGHVYSPDDGGICIPTDLWHVKNPERFDAFLKVTMKTVFSPGVGLPGRVYESGEPVWVKDVTKDVNFPRAKIAEEIGIKAGFAFPVMDGENVSSVLEFFTTIAVEPDPSLLDTVKHLATQLGRLTERKRIERELSLKNYAIDSSMSAMMIANHDYKITYVNQKMCELWGYAEKDLLGRDTSILRAEDHLKGTVQKILSEKGEYEGEFLARRKDRSEFIALFSSSMVEDRNGKIVSNITSFVDLTERIRNEEALRESSRQLEESQRVANLGTYTLDISSGVCSTSIIHDRIYGINNPGYIMDIEGWLKIIHPEQREEIKSYFTNHVLAKGVRFDKEYRIVRLNDRQERWVHDLGELIFDQAGRPVKMIGTIQDITERKRAEKALITAKEAAEAATKLKDKFVALASHDLRSPISSITGFLNFLKSDTKNPLCQEHNDIVNRMILTTDHQLNMIDGLLDLTRMQTGNILLEPRFANANLIGENIVQNMLYMAQAKEITLVNDLPVNARLYADITYFSEVVSNLVSNSIKFCNKGDMVRLFAPDNKNSIIAVSDTGVGIGSETLCKLFAQEDKTSTIGTAGEKGAGLGLPYSYEIMQAHGGDLYAESAIGEGTVFFAKLPYVKPQLLIVDDDEKVRGLIKAYLDPLDVYIRQAVNGNEAIEILKLFVPHLIITDISMPALDGLQLLEHVRGNPAIKSVPVIMTGTDMHLREKAFQMQASDFITKPLMEDEFIPRIRRFIG